MATKAYFSQDWGQAIYYNGVPYVRRGHVSTKPDSSIGSDDHTDLGHHGASTYGNDGETFNQDNSSPYSSSWSLEQCIIAALPDYSSIDYDAGTFTEDFTDAGGPVNFFSAPSDGELRVWARNDIDDHLGKNGKEIKTINGAYMDDSVALRVVAGETIQVAGDEDEYGNLVDPPNGKTAWMFLPDEY